MNARVTAIETRRGTRARRVLLDGELWRMLPADLVGALELFEGEDVEVVALADRLAEVEPSFAYRRALKLLSRRDYSITTLTERLRRDGYCLEAVGAAVERLRDNGLLDDMRYAEALARSLRRRGLGSRRVLAEFARRGLDEVLAAADDTGECEADRAEAMARRLARVGGDPARLAAKLVRRGYDPALSIRVAKTVIRSLESPLEP